MKLGSSFFRLPKYKTFHYEPRYYDPEKEAREERRREIEARIKGEDTTENTSNRISRAFREHRKKHKSSSAFELKTSSIRLLIIGILLGLMYAYIEFGDTIENKLFSDEGSVSNSMYWIIGVLGLYILMKISKR